MSVDENMEHERKFLVRDLAVLGSGPGTEIVQGYPASFQGYALRVRLSRNPDYCTLNVKRSAALLSRKEVECEISRDVAESLFELCGAQVIAKTRYPVPGPAGTWTIDVFHDRNEGLVLAEVELSDPSTVFAPPPWCGPEVTGDERYYNEYLAVEPFERWTV